MLKQFAATLLAVFGIAAGPVAQWRTQQDLVTALSSGPLTDRYQAARDILQMPPNNAVRRSGSRSRKSFSGLGRRPTNAMTHTKQVVNCCRSARTIPATIKTWSEP